MEKGIIMSNNNIGRKVAGATLGTLGGIIAMPFATAGVAVTGTLATAGLSVCTLGLAAVPCALVTAGATVGTVFTSPFVVGKKIYSAVSGEETESAVEEFVEAAFEDICSRL
jgi:hypothetical protein